MLYLFSNSSASINSSPVPFTSGTYISHVFVSMVTMLRREIPFRFISFNFFRTTILYFEVYLIVSGVVMEPTQKVCSYHLWLVLSCLKKIVISWIRKLWISTIVSISLYKWGETCLCRTLNKLKSCINQSLNTVPM
jgi:hypothetical protein